MACDSTLAPDSPPAAELSERRCDTASGRRDRRSGQRVEVGYGQGGCVRAVRVAVVAAFRGTTITEDASAPNWRPPPPSRVPPGPTARSLAGEWSFTLTDHADERARPGTAHRQEPPSETAGSDGARGTQHHQEPDPQPIIAPDEGQTVNLHQGQARRWHCQRWNVQELRWRQVGQELSVCQTPTTSILGLVSLVHPHRARFTPW